MQAYLYRSPTDLGELLDRPGRERIVKGAFDAPSDLAMRGGAEPLAADIGFLDRLETQESGTQYRRTTWILIANSCRKRL